MTIFDTSKLKAFANDKLEIGTHDLKFTNTLKKNHCGETEKMLVTKIFYFFHNTIKLSLQGLFKPGIVW